MSNCAATYSYPALVANALNTGEAVSYYNSVLYVTVRDFNNQGNGYVVYCTDASSGSPTCAATTAARNYGNPGMTPGYAGFLYVNTGFQPGTIERCTITAGDLTACVTAGYTNQNSVGLLFSGTYGYWTTTDVSNYMTVCKMNATNDFDACKNTVTADPIRATKLAIG